MEEVGDRIRLTHIDGNGNKLLIGDMTPRQLKQLAAVLAAQAIGTELKETLTPEQVKEVNLVGLMKGVLASLEFTAELIATTGKGVKFEHGGLVA